MHLNTLLNQSLGAQSLYKACLTVKAIKFLFFLVLFFRLVNIFLKKMQLLSYQVVQFQHYIVPYWRAGIGLP